MHAVDPGAEKLHLGDLPAGLVIESQKDLPALQCAAFSDDKTQGLILVVINRSDADQDVTVELGKSRLYQHACIPAAGLAAVVTQYSALTRGAGRSLFQLRFRASFLGPGRCTPP